MATYIAGIAASQAWDTSGESIDIKKMDISSLEGAVLNWEHKSEKSSDYVGKILKAKKVFKAEDCANEIELKYWNKYQLPFLFCLGVLFDDYQPAAKEVAGIFKFDHDNPSLPPTLGFSIEGAKLDKDSGVITHSIARKLTITAQPANKTCLAGKVDMSEANKKPHDDLLDIFKSEIVEIELFGEEVMQKMEMHPKLPKPAKPGLKQAPQAKGSAIGKTNAGHPVFSTEKVHNYKHFSAEDHRNAANIHGNAATAANAAKDFKSADHHNQKMKLHNGAAAGLERKASRFANGIKSHAQRAENNKILGKALGAGSGMGNPGNATQGDALQKKKLSKSEWLERANQEYKTWDKKEEFRVFMKSRMPSLTMVEIDSFGKTLALKKSLVDEKNLETIIKGSKK